MERRNLIIILCIIYMLSLGVRLYYANETQYFADSNAYFIQRQIESVRQDGRPLYDDPLSFGGRRYIFLPAYYYFLSFFSLLLPIGIVLKVVPNIIAAGLVFAVYLFSYQMTKDEKVSLVGAFVSGFIPVYLAQTANTASIYSVVLPLMVLLMYLILRINITKDPYYFILVLCTLLVLHPSVIYLAMAMGFYLLIAWAEGLNVGRGEIEITIFSIMLSVWFYLMFYRQALSVHGPSIIWQNIPTDVLSLYFSEINLLQALFYIGIIPLLAGIWVIYQHLFRKKKKSVYLLISFSVVISMLLVLRSIELVIGLMFLGLIFTLLFSEFLLGLLAYLEKTKAHRFMWLILIGVVVIFLLTSVLPGFMLLEEKNTQVPDAELITALQIIRDETPDDATIIASLEEGHLITYFAKNKNVMDSNFLFVPDASQRFSDVRTIYTSAVEYRAIELMEKYGSDYLLFTSKAGADFNISRISYVGGECFSPLYNGRNVRLYERRCGIA